MKNKKETKKKKQKEEEEEETKRGMWNSQTYNPARNSKNSNRKPMVWNEVNTRPIPNHRIGKLLISGRRKGYNI